MDIDLVYFWCDGADENFIAKKQKYSSESIEDTSNIDARFIQFDELKYSLRSICKNIDWIHHIFIVTDGQIPKWLNLCDKITIVDHKELLPEKYLPTFNILALESVVWKIPNLSEFFLLANDDTFVNKSLNKEYFFDDNERAIVRFNDWFIGKSLYGKQLNYSQNIYNAKFNKTTLYRTHHNIDAYRKSICKNCYELFKDEFEFTQQCRFMGTENMHRIVFSRYAIDNNFGTLVMNDIKSKYLTNVLDQEIIKSGISESNLFCLNDTRFSTAIDRTNAVNIIHKTFTNKTIFEKEV